ncbi:MAG TPA: glycosyltransferase [Propionibacteriaceae bacterium]|nr:glycosyltransferase [Propionibacteriaceae bacterium]
MGIRGRIVAKFDQPFHPSLVMIDSSNHGRFLLALIDTGGTVPPALGVAAELVRRGHQVRVLADPTVAAAASAAGCAFTPWQEAPHFNSLAEQTALIDAFEGRNPYRALRALKHFAGRGMTQRFADEVIATTQSFPVDAVLADGVNPGIVIGGLASGLPTVALMANIYVRPTIGRPLLGTGWSPARNVLGRARDRLAPTAAQWLLARTLPRVNAVVTSFGYPPLNDLFDYLDRCTRVLVMTSPSFDFPPPLLPDNVRYVGPQVDDPHWATQRPWKRNDGEPLVLVATSSVYQDQTDLLGRIAEGLGQLSVRAVITTGRAVEPKDVPAPPNVEVLQAAPHQQILTHASAVVTHAGHGTVLKALSAGVPLVCIPMGRDQKDNTVRVLRLGAGVRLSDRSTPSQIAAAVSDVLRNAQYASAARRFADVLRQEARNAPSAADEAEALIRPATHVE